MVSSEIDSFVNSDLPVSVAKNCWEKIQNVLKVSEH
jgi:hypothetical protein